MQKTLIAALLAGAFFSLDANAADLIQVYQQALANDAVYASARDSQQAGRERVPQGKSALYPVIGFNAGVTRNMGNVVSGVGQTVLLPDGSSDVDQQLG